MATEVKLEELNCTLNIFLKLKINPGFISKIFTEANYERRVLPTVPDLGIPGIETSPVGVEPTLIFKTGNHMAAYSPDSSAIQIAGPVNDIAGALDSVIQILRKNGIDIPASVRYLEFHMGYSPEVPNCINGLRSGLSYNKLRYFKEVFDDDMRFYGMTLGNSDSALSDNWTRIKLEPDLFRPNYGSFDIAKRSPTVENMKNFLLPIAKRLSRLTEIVK